MSEIFINKYAPKDIKTAIFHKDILEKLQVMSTDESIPHIIFYGPSGSGKKTLINMFLEMIYDKEINKLSDTIYNITGSGNAVTEISIKQSNYHIVIEPNNNNFDRYLIQNVVKEYAKRIPLGVFQKKRIFKTVLINNIDNMSYYAQTSLRRTMEIYSGTCRFIMWSRSLSEVIDPLRSRCYCFRIRSPTDSELFELLLNVSFHENIQMSLKQYDNVLCLADGNIKKALWIMQFIKMNENFLTSYDCTITKIVNILIKHKLSELPTIRVLLYTIMITNVNGSQIVQDIVNRLMMNPTISPESKIIISEIGAKYEHTLVLCRREIMHLEPFVTNIMYQLHLDSKKN